MPACSVSGSESSGPGAVATMGTTKLPASVTSVSSSAKGAAVGGEKVTSSRTLMPGATAEPGATPEGAAGPSPPWLTLSSPGKAFGMASRKTSACGGSTRRWRETLSTFVTTTLACSTAPPS